MLARIAAEPASAFECLINAEPDAADPVVISALEKALAPDPERSLFYAKLVRRWRGVSEVIMSALK
jgi:hypothetical protein